MALSLPRIAPLPGQKGRGPVWCLWKENDQKEELAVTAPDTRLHTHTTPRPNVYTFVHRDHNGGHNLQRRASMDHHHDLLMAEPERVRI
jgi:hypothetical protein